MGRHETLRRNADLKAQAFIGKKYGRLIVVKAGPGRTGGRRFNCVCECGRTAFTTIYNLQNGKTKSCGCWRVENRKILSITHGLRHTPEYEIWKTMRQRCLNPKNKKYPDYGGRGIKICEQWGLFENFIADMGYRPADKKSIDRINNDGHYEPSNCRWATSVEQVRNRRNLLIAP